MSLKKTARHTCGPVKMWLTLRTTQKPAAPVWVTGAWDLGIKDLLIVLFFSIFLDSELSLLEYTEDSELTEESRQTIQTQFEWIFISMSERKKTINHFGFNQTVVVYTVSISGFKHVQVSYYSCVKPLAFMSKYEGLKVRK